MEKPTDLFWLNQRARSGSNHSLPTESCYLNHYVFHLFQRVCNGIRGSTHSQFQSYYLCYFGTVYFGDRFLEKGVGNQPTFGFRTPPELVILVLTSLMVQSRNLAIHLRPVESILLKHLTQNGVFMQLRTASTVIFSVFQDRISYYWSWI